MTLMMTFMTMLYHPGNKGATSWEPLVGGVDVRRWTSQIWAFVLWNVDEKSRAANAVNAEKVRKQIFFPITLTLAVGCSVFQYR